uniref:Heat shock factor protein 5 n=1 Tax=Geotrypetes seraphini TaxID=260995 RepID=A0A6P8PRB8_GEOSA|nr:heat shock factor protein 5 [Geotrypetes seraphini]
MSCHVLSPTVNAMEVENALLSTPINPNNFPAKLWRLVNSPRYRSIRWDARGEGLIIDQQLFESELLCPTKPVDEGSELFKTTNFTSFIRQLNLYGFRKVVLGAGSNPGNLHPGGDLGAGDGHLHHFHSVHFRKDHPEMLVNLKRLTSANKAKLAAGMEVNSRPPNRFQRLLSNSLDSMGKGEKPGPVTVGQLHRSFRRDNLSPYSYASASPHSHSTFPVKGLDRTPIPPRTWQNSLGMLPSQVDTPPAFSEKEIPFPVLQRFPTEVTYTLQPTVTSVPIQQGPQNMTSSSQKYSNYTAASAQYSQAYYPAAVLQCCSPPAHMESLTGCPNPTGPSYQHCSYFQSPPIQSSYPVEFLPSNWSCAASEESKKNEVNLEAVFQIVDELHSSPKLEMVKVHHVESQDSPASQPSRDQQIPTTSVATSDATCTSQSSQLESLTPVVSDITSFVVGTDQSIASSLPQASDFIYTMPSSQTADSRDNTSTAAVIVQGPAASQQVSVKVENQLSPAPAQPVVVLLEEGMSSSPQQVDADLKSHTHSSHTVLPAEQMEFLISEVTSAGKPGKELSLATPMRSRERRGSSQQGKSPDLHLLVDVACKQEHFPKEEDLGE